MTQEFVKLSCDTTKFPSLTFCGPKKKPHRVWGLRKHYNIQLDKKLGYVTCEIIQ